MDELTVEESELILDEYSFSNSIFEASYFLSFSIYGVSIKSNWPKS
jgi:hypothetical protein